MSLWFWSIFPSYSHTSHSVFLTLMLHTIHFYDLHRPAAHFESIVVNFAQILPSCKGYIPSSLLWLKSTSSSSLNSSKGRRKAELPLLLRLFLYLDLSRSAPCKRAPSENVRKSGQILLPPYQIGLERINIHPRLILHVTKILFDSSQLWLQVHPMCANYRFWY